MMSGGCSSWGEMRCENKSQCALDVAGIRKDI